MSITLSRNQEEALQALLRFEKSNEKCFLLSGSAGTGKTTLIGEYVKASNKNIILGAPTHKSRKVLASKSLGTEVSTIHSLLGLKVDIKNGKTSLKQVGKSATGNFLSVVVVDEASMLDKELMNYIEDDIKKANNKYVFLGDAYQLPPVESDSSPVFENHRLITSQYQLKEIIRQAAGNPIITIATAIRDMIETGNITDFPFETNSIGSVQAIDKDEMINLSKMLYLSEDYYNNVDFVKTVAWTNEAVHKYNSFVNKLFKVPAGEDFVIGSKVMFNEAYSKSQNIDVQNNAEATVKKIQKKIRNGIFYDTLTLEFDDVAECVTGRTEYDVVSHSSRMDYNKLLDNLKREAIATKSWGKYYQLKNSFADIRPNFSLTTTKAQGSTYNNVIIDLNDIMKVREKKRLLQHLYVAITRSSGNVFLLD